MSGLEMWENEPLLSIVVPTRNRAAYAVTAVRSLLRLPDARCEIVVEDNSDDGSLEEGLGGEMADPRLRYRRTDVPVSMTENYERACARAKGVFVCMIGDDDTVMPQVMSACRWASEEGLDALVVSTPAHYVWPDLDMSKPGAQRPAELRLGAFTGGIRPVDAMAELAKCLRSAGQQFGELPRLYYGVVRRECIARARKELGVVFPGVSPDLAAAIALAPHLRRVRALDFPLFLPGSSGRSNAGLAGLGEHVGELSKQKHLPPDCESTWSRIVPAFYSVPTVWAETAVSATRRLARPELMRLFNVAFLYAWLWTFYPSFRPVIRRAWSGAVREVELETWRARGLLAKELCGIWALRGRFLARRLTGRRPHSGETRFSRGPRDIYEAQTALGELIGSGVPSFERLRDLRHPPDGT